MFKRKLEKLLKLVQELDLDVLILTQQANVEYLLELPLESPTVYIALYRDSTYRIYVAKLDYWRLLDLLQDVEREQIVSFTRPGTGQMFEREIPVNQLVEHIISKDFRKVGIDKESREFVNKVRKVSESIEVKCVEDKVLEVRSIKDSDEIDFIKTAVKIAEKCLEEVIHKVKPGVREVNIEGELLRCIAEHEAEPAFKPIVASGPNSAYPHHVSTRRRIQDGDVVVIDVGVRYHCYCSDITRTIVVGSVSPRQREVLEAVLEAQQRAISGVKPGVETHYVDSVARSVLAERNLADYFIHSTGHGLGVECHEKPSIAPGEKARLETGNVVTVEPGVYLRGEFGVRIEDDVVVTETGHEVLSRFPRVLF